MSETIRNPKVGDRVIIHAVLCEWDGIEGEIVAISSDPENIMPYLVQRSDYFEWPFTLGELELISLENECYEG